MAGITALGTTYNLPNYTGLLFQLTPADTPFLSATGGLSGGGQTISPQFEWETFDLRGAAQNVALEGAAAPTAQERVRGQVKNVVELHQEKISVSYTKQAAVGQKAGLANAVPNPIQNEVDWQTAQMLKQIARDVEYAFINGRYNLPVDNTTTRQTMGLRQAITTNRTNVGTLQLAAAVVAPSTITITGTTLANGNQVVLRNVTAGIGVDDAHTYYVVNKAVNTVQLAATLGGAPITLGTGVADVWLCSGTPLSKANIDVMLQQVYDNGGIMEADTATVIVNSSQKIALTNAYGNAFGKYFEQSRTIGGVAFETILTDFGTLNVMLDRLVPKDTVIVCSLEMCMPVFEEIPGKGHFFAEPLAKTGSSDDVQIYGEVGLAFGNQLAHGIIEGLPF